MVAGRFLEELFTSRVRVRILTQLLLHSRQEYYLQELSDLEGLPSPVVLRELGHLARMALVAQRRRKLPPGGIVRRVWRANVNHVVYPELKALLLKSQLLRRAIERRSARAPLTRIRVAFVFGSVAGAEEDAQSDLDLVVVGEASDMELQELFKGVDLAHEINSINYTVEEFVRKAGERGSFEDRIARGPKIFLVGDADRLYDLVRAKDQRTSPDAPQSDAARDRESVRGRGSKSSGR